MRWGVCGFAVAGGRQFMAAFCRSARCLGHLPHHRLSHYTVFSGYLDQGIMSAVFAALCWHLRGLVPGRYGPQVAIAVAVASLANVFFVLAGRSGQLVGVALLSLAIMWQLPKKYRIVVAVLPFLLMLALFVSSPTMRERLTLLKTEVQAYSPQQDTNTSSGVRLTFWRMATQLIAQRPLAGAGVGSWSTEYNRLERQKNPAHKNINPNGNPHQEYLYWGVQLGIPGLLLFAAFCFPCCATRRRWRYLTPGPRNPPCWRWLSAACSIPASMTA
jgi:O-antigen ligase